MHLLLCFNLMSDAQNTCVLWCRLNSTMTCLLTRCWRAPRRTSLAYAMEHGEWRIGMIWRDCGHIFIQKSALVRLVKTIPSCWLKHRLTPKDLEKAAEIFLKLLTRLLFHAPQATLSLYARNDRVVLDIERAYPMFASVRGFLYPMPWVNRRCGPRRYESHDAPFKKIGACIPHVSGARGCANDQRGMLLRCFQS